VAADAAGPKADKMEIKTIEQHARADGPESATLKDQHRPSIDAFGGGIDRCYSL
jgi:hypothetical protein